MVEKSTISITSLLNSEWNERLNEPNSLMDSLNSLFLHTQASVLYPSRKTRHRIPIQTRIRAESLPVRPDPWTLRDADPTHPRPRWKNPKNPLSDDNARRIIKKKAEYLSLLRRNQGPQAQTPRWIKRSPDQMVQFLRDDRHGHLYGRHVVAAIRRVRALSQLPDGAYEMRIVMGSFVGKLSFREMCVVLKEQKGWKQVRDFFAWMKLQLSYHPSVIVYTIVLRIYGQVGKIQLAEQTFLEMLEAGCEPDQVACGTMLCTYARWGRHEAMLSFYSAVRERGVVMSVAVFNFMLSSLQKKALHRHVIELWTKMVKERVVPNNFTYTVVIGSLYRESFFEEAYDTFDEMRSAGFVPEEVTYSQIISLSTKKGKWDKALMLYEDMRAQRIVPSNYTCASLLTLYYKTQDYSKALRLFAEMERYKIASDEVIYGLLIRIYGKLGLFEDARRTFEETEQLGLLSDEKTYLAMAQVNLSSGDFVKALEVIDLMKNRNIRFSRFALIVLLQCYVMKKDMVSAESTFQALSKTGLADAGSCNDMLQLYLDLGLIAKANELIARVRKESVIFDDELFKTVIRFYCKEGMRRDAQQLIEEMGTSELFTNNRFVQTISRFMCESRGDKQLDQKLLGSDEPDTVGLGLVIDMYISDRNFSETEKVLRELLETSNGVSVARQLVRNFIREGNSYKAKTLIHQLLKLKCRLDDSVIGSLISLCGKQRKLKQAEEVFLMFADSPVSQNGLCKYMVDAYVKCGKADEAYSLYKKVTETGDFLDAVAISIVVNSLSSSEKHQEAETVIRRSLENHVDLDIVAYNTFIKAMFDAGRLHFASSIYEHSLSVGVAPSIETYNTMISVYGRGRNLDSATEMFNNARRSGLSLDEKVYMNLVGYLGKAGKRHEASLLFTEMLENGIKPGMVSYNIMINVFASGGFYEAAEQLFKAMKEDSHSPDSFTYLSLIRAYTVSLKYTEAEKIIDSMQKKGISVSCAHFNLLLSAFAKSGLMAEAERVFKRLLRVGLKPDLPCMRNMLRGYMDFAHIEDGIKFFESIRESTEFDKFIMSAGVHFYKYAGNEQKAKSVLDSMSDSGVVFMENLRVGSKLESV